MSDDKGLPKVKEVVEAEDGTSVMFEGMRRPHPGETVRVHPSKDRRKTVLLAIDDEGKYYLVADHMEEYVLKHSPPGRARRATLFQAASIDGVNFLWPVFLPISPQHPVFTAMQHWVKLESPSSLH